VLSWAFFLFALRSYILACQPKKSATSRSVDIALGTFSLILFFLLPAEFFWKPFAVLAAMVAVSIYLRFTRPYTFSFYTAAAWSCLYTVGAVVATSCALFNLAENKKVAKVILTGQTRSEWVTWKNPSQANIDGAWFESHEVVVQDPQGKELCREYIYGDLVGLRAEVVTIEWPFRLLGFSNLCHLETLYNGYKTAQRHNRFPHAALALPFSAAFFQHLWENLYQGKWHIPGIKTASLESAYLPLNTKAEYWLEVGGSGLMAEPQEK
jgi:hypothetical protein